MFAGMKQSLIWGETLFVPICLDVFTRFRPIRTQLLLLLLPCGTLHPVCEETFETRPDLKVNALISGRTSSHSTSGAQKNNRQLCDIYTDAQQEAVKSCLQRSSRASSGREVPTWILTFFCRNNKILLPEPWHCPCAAYIHRDEGCRRSCRCRTQSQREPSWGWRWWNSSSCPTHRTCPHSVVTYWPLPFVIASQHHNPPPHSWCASPSLAQHIHDPVLHAERTEASGSQWF